VGGGDSSMLQAPREWRDFPPIHCSTIILIAHYFISVIVFSLLFIGSRIGMRQTPPGFAHTWRPPFCPLVVKEFVRRCIQLNSLCEWLVWSRVSLCVLILLWGVHARHLLLLALPLLGLLTLTPRPLSTQRVCGLHGVHSGLAAPPLFWSNLASPSRTLISPVPTPTRVGSGS
jgi:hypothetical protein